MKVQHYVRRKRTSITDDVEAKEPTLPQRLHLKIVCPGKYVTWEVPDYLDSVWYQDIWEIKKPYTTRNSFQIGSDDEECGSGSDSVSTVSKSSKKYDDPMLNVMWREVQAERQVNALIDFKLQQDRIAWATTQYKLTSLDGKGEAELIRLMFVYAGEPFQNERITSEQWEEMKPNTPYQTLPVLSKCGKQWGDTGAIVRVLARRFLLMGSTNDEHLVVEACYERLQRLKRQNERAITWVITGEKNKERQEWARSQLLHVVLPPAMKEWEQLITQTRGPFVVASGITLADLAIMDFLDQCSSCMMIDSLFSDHLAVADLFSIVRSCPKIAAYLDQRTVD